MQFFEWTIPLRHISHVNVGTAGYWLQRDVETNQSLQQCSGSAAFGPVLHCLNLLHRNAQISGWQLHYSHPFQVWRSPFLKLFFLKNYFKSQKSEWWRVFEIFRSVADQEWAARLKHSAKNTGVWLGGLVCWHTIQVHLHHDHWLHGLVSDSDHSWSPLTVTCLLTGSIRWRRRCLTLWLWLVAGLWGLCLTLACLSAVWSHGHSGAQVHLEDDIFLQGWLFDTNSMKIVLNVQWLAHRNGNMGHSTLQHNRGGVVRHRPHHMQVARRLSW